jgi:hypothetical protein
MTLGLTRCGPRSINADNSGSEEERAAGGPGQGAVDPAHHPGERGVLTDRMTAEWESVGPNITRVGRTYGMGRVDHSVADVNIADVFVVPIESILVHADNICALQALASADTVAAPYLVRSALH